jgi:hypothetical protein
MDKFNLNLTKTIFENINDLRFLAGKEIYYHLKAFEDLGLTKYTKRNYKNWHYWWYEVDAIKQKPNKNDFLADLTAFEITFKGWKFYQIITDPENDFVNFSSLYLKLTDWENCCETIGNNQYFIDRIDFQLNKNLRMKQYQKQLEFQLF